MAIVVERTTPKVDSSSNVAVLVFTGTPTVGNDVIVVNHAYEGASAVAPASYADNASGGSNAYTAAVYVENAGGSDCAAITRAPIDRTTSGLQVTVTGAPVSALMCGAALEVSGLAAAPLDKTGSNAADNTSTWSQATGALDRADELVVAVMCYAATALGTYALASAGAWTGSTQIYVNDGPAIAAEYGIGSYHIVSSTASVTAEYSANASSAGGSPIVVATFMADSGAPVPTYANTPRIDELLAAGAPLGPYSWVNAKNWF